MDCVVYLEGSVARINGRDVGIYVSRGFQGRIRGLQGRRVRVILIIEGCSGGGNEPGC
jgi:hypothetical protein